MEFVIEQESIKLEAVIYLQGEDWLISITGGERPHIGAVAIAIPHVGIKDCIMDGATVSVFNIPGHRDGMIAEYCGKTISTLTQKNVVVACGIHFNVFSEQKKQQVLKLSKLLCEDIVMHIRKEADL